MQNEMTDGSGINQAVARRFGVQGAPFPNVASEVFPTIPLVGESRDISMDALQGVRRYHFAGASAAGAALPSNVGLINPAGSGALIELRAIVSNISGNPQVWEYGISMGLPVGTDAETNGVQTDSRNGIGNVSIGRVFTRSNQTIAPSQGIVAVNTGDPVVIPYPFILWPGSFWAVHGPNIVTVVATLWWTERAISAGESVGAFPT